MKIPFMGKAVKSELDLARRGIVERLLVGKHAPMDRVDKAVGSSGINHVGNVKLNSGAKSHIYSSKEGGKEVFFHANSPIDSSNPDRKSVV